MDFYIIQIITEFYRGLKSSTFGDNVLSVECPCGGMVDATDLKSVGQLVVGVRVPPRAPCSFSSLFSKRAILCSICCIAVLFLSSQPYFWYCSQLDLFKTLHFFDIKFDLKVIKTYNTPLSQM